MDDLIKKFYKISPRLRQRIYDLIHGENNISQVDNKLILNNEIYEYSKFLKSKIVFLEVFS